MFDITQEEDYRELTLEEQYLVNGGAEVANTNEAVANSKPGDTVTRDDKTTHVITQGDINWAKEHCGANTGGAGNGNTGQPSYGSGGPSGESGGASSTIPKSTKESISNSSNTSKANYTIDDKNKIISADINDPEGIMEAYSRYYMLSDRGYAFELKDGKNHVHTFSDSKYVEKYIKSINKFENHFSEVMDNLSTTSGLANDIMRRTVLNADTISEMTGFSINTAKISMLSKVASNISKFTGVIGLWLNTKKFKNEPTFRNGIKILSGGVSFANPWFGLGVSAGGEAVAEVATGILTPISCVASRKYQFDSILNNLEKQNTVGVFSIVDKNQVYTANLGFIQGLRYIFQ